MDVSGSIGTVRLEVLDIDNYDTWSCDMKWLLISKGLWSVISDSENAQGDSDAKALALLGLNVAKHHKASLAACASAAAAWDMLADAYKAKSNARRLQLRREMNNLKMVGNEPLSKYFARGRAIMDQLLAAGHDIKEEELVWSLLAGLPDVYDSMVNVLEGADDTPSLETVMAKLLIVEQRVWGKINSNGDAGNSTTALYTNVNKTKSYGQGPVCWYCNEKGHLKRDCPKLKDKKLVGLTVAL
jgi:hypothetical protein